MRRSLVLLCSVLTLALSSALPAGAATTSVNGTGSYEKLVVNNGSRTLIFKIHAPGGDCVIKYLAVKFRDRDGTRYEVDGGCYGAGEWIASLVRGSNIIACDRFSLRYNEDGGVWTATIPRTCLKRLGAAVKVTESWVDDYGPTINEVPATKYVAQG